MWRQTIKHSAMTQKYWSAEDLCASISQSQCRGPVVQYLQRSASLGHRPAVLQRHSPSRWSSGSPQRGYASILGVEPGDTSAQRLLAGEGDFNPSPRQQNNNQGLSSDLRNFQGSLSLRQTCCYTRHHGHSMAARFNLPDSYKNE